MAQAQSFSELMRYTDREYQGFPSEFPDPPAPAGFNRQWVPVLTDAYSGWFLLPLELSAAQLTEVERRIAVKEAAEKEEGAAYIPLSVATFAVIQHLMLDARIDHLEPAMWQDPTGLSMPSTRLCKAISEEALMLVARARSLGNSLRPYTGTTKPGAAANSTAGNRTGE